MSAVDMKSTTYYKSGKHKKNALAALARATLANQSKSVCRFCSRGLNRANITRHEEACYLNPLNKKCCVVCYEIIKNRASKGTCSKRCSNKQFRSGENNGNWKGTSYITICFANHKKECIICGEDKIVAVHRCCSSL